MVKYIENYALYEEIGSGVYGKVFRAINNNDKKQYAIKVIPITKFRENKKLEECTVNEINILTNIEAHPHIIRYYDMLKTSNNFYFIYQYCNGGTLDGLIAKEGRIPQNKSLLIFKQLLDAFQILNKYNILHRDMKPDNIFFHNGVIKLGDFGFCKNLSSADEMTRTMLGSPIYMAPQVLKGEIYSNKADIWSLGVVLYEMIFGVCPFQSNSIAKLIEVLNTKQLQFPEDAQISMFLKQIISRMLTKDPMQRIGWMQLFQIKINSQGFIQSSEVHPKIMSLEQAKVSKEAVISNSSKVIPRQSNLEQPNSNMANFKKEKKGSNIGTCSTSNSGSSNDNMKESRIISKQHKIVMEGIKIAMDVIQSKIPNHMGYGYLLLNHALKINTELLSKTHNLELKPLLEKQVKDLKAQQEAINLKMFSYEQKGLEDWKKYLRGKFFQEEKTIGVWFRMVQYLSSNYSSTASTPSFKAMVETIKNILY